MNFTGKKAQRTGTAAFKAAYESGRHFDVGLAIGSRPKVPDLPGWTY